MIFRSPFFPMLALFSLASAGSAEERPPNVVLLFTDDHGTLDVNCYGSDDLITPHMDRLAENGVRFTQAYAHKYCCPARASLMTGRHPQRTGVHDWTRGDRKETDRAVENLKPSEVTMAEMLKAAGYRTGLFGKWHLGAKAGHGPLEQGFDEFFGHLGGFIDNYRHYFLHGRGFHDLYDGNEEIDRRGEYFPDMMVDRALEFIGREDGQPFFAYIAFNLPHYPEQPIGEFADAYAELPMPRRSYARVLSTVDSYVGQVLDKLDEIGKREDTIVILMGDNGHSTENKSGIDVDGHSSGFPKGHYYSAHGGGGNTGKWIGAKGDFLEGGIRVPAMLSYPRKFTGGTVRNQIVTVMDWFPTVAELTGTALPSVEIDGHSVVPLVEDANASSQHQVLHFEWPNGWAIRERDWKLLGFRNKGSQKRLHLELRNVADPKPESKNYAEERPDLVERLTAMHEAWAKSIATK
jgi:arylsulfatase A-like enzyme